MHKETLMTFYFDAPSDAKTVELLGSWDGFTNAYPLRPDRRRGNEHWTGCFRFVDVIFDGSEITTPRTGGLMQGGAYWYFFRLNDVIETYDDRLTTRSDCPLLPGQPVNFIEVPAEVEKPSTRARNDSIIVNMLEKLAENELAYTLDPASRYEPCFNPANATALPRRTSLPESLADLQYVKDVSTAGSVKTTETFEHDAWRKSTAREQSFESSQDHERDLTPARDGQSMMVPAQQRAQSIDVSSFGVMRWWKRAYKVHARSMSGTSQCYQAMVPPEVWGDPCELLVASLQRYQSPIVA